MVPRLRRSAALAAAALVALASGGCVTRTVREKVYERDGIVVILRGEKRGGTRVDQGYDHPITISGVRLAHILSRIDLEDESGKKRERRPAIATEILYPMADALGRGLAAAGPSQQVIVRWLQRKKHLAVFDEYYLTSLLVWAEQDVLYVQVGRSEWSVPKRRLEMLPEPHAGEHPQAFRLLVVEGMSLVDPQTAAVEWRSPIFAKPTRTMILPGGQVKRKTVLMESLEETEPPPAPRTVPTDLTPEQLRALADLEEARRAGKLSEAAYAAERGRILGVEPAPQAAEPAPDGGEGAAQDAGAPEAPPGR